MRTFIMSIMLFAALATVTFSEDKPKGKIHGYTLTDYYFMVGNHDANLENQNGFWFRRIYFGYDHQISDEFSSRVRFEMTQNDGFDGTKTVMSAAVKDAYLKWKSGKQSVIVGMQGTPTWGLVENIWGYRSVEKTPLDMQKNGSSRDIGIGAKGQFDSEGIVKYHVMFGNGSSNKNETYRGKALMGAIAFYPIEGLIIEGYYDHADTKQGQSSSILQGFAAYQTDAFRVGAQYANQTISVDGIDDQKIGMVSGFAVVKLSDNFNLIGRVDKFLDVNPTATKNTYLPFAANAKSTLIIAGIDYSPVKNVKIIPNIEMVSYEVENGMPELDGDLLARITFYYAFK